MKYLKTIDNVTASAWVRTLDIGTLGVVTRRQTGVCPVQRRVERRGGGRAVIRHRSVSGWRCRCRGSVAVEAVPGGKQRKASDGHQGSSGASLVAVGGSEEAFLKL